MKKFAFLVLVVLGTTVLMAHPHFRKTVTVALPGGVEATISYQTVPGNEMHAENAQIGSFITPRGPRLTLSGELRAGSVSLPAGEYTIGVVKNGASDWTLALYPGRLGRRETPDVSKLIKLDSMFSDSSGKTEHLLVDITPGHGKFEGKAVLTVKFGKLFLDGALT